MANRFSVNNYEGNYWQNEHMSKTIITRSHAVACGSLVQHIPLGFGVHSPTSKYEQAVASSALRLSSPAIEKMLYTLPVPLYQDKNEGKDREVDTRRDA